MGQNNMIEEVGKCVWIIEDNELYKRNLISLLHESSNLTCIKSFNRCEDAISELRDSWEPEILLVDIGLPGMSGLEGIQKLKKISPGSQIIMLTVYDDDDKVFAALCAGASGYLLKTSSADKIIEAINDVVNGGVVMNPPIAKKVIDIFIKNNTPVKNYDLTEREKQILEMMIKGLTKKKIADQLYLSFHTIDTHLRSIYNKLHVHSKSSAIVKSIREHIV